jgi:L-ascorbate metabolism protein UlaG (beta-lactamase superfamily)
LTATGVLTDPWFSERFGYYHGEPYGIALADLPRLDAVVVTHAHYDHYDLGAFRADPERAVPMVVKRGLGEKARKAGFTDVREVDAWESTTVGSVQVTATPGKHGVPEVTFVLAVSRRIIFFGGDTLLIPELREVGRRFPSIDLALLPVNGLVLRLMFNRQVVMNAKEAAELCAILRPRWAVPIHYAFRGRSHHGPADAEVHGNGRRVSRAGCGEGTADPGANPGPGRATFTRVASLTR